MRLILTPWHRDWALKGVTSLVSLNKKGNTFFVVVVERNAPEPCEPDDPHCEATTHKWVTPVLQLKSTFALETSPGTWEKNQRQVHLVWTQSFWHGVDLDGWRRSEAIFKNELSRSITACASTDAVVSTFVCLSRQQFDACALWIHERSLQLACVWKWLEVFWGCFFFVSIWQTTVEWQEIKQRKVGGKVAQA